MLIQREKREKMISSVLRFGRALTSQAILLFFFYLPASVWKKDNFLAPGTHTGVHTIVS